MGFVIEPLLASDWPQVAVIFTEWIATGNATLETETPSWEKWDADHLTCCRLVARNGEHILGWIALTPVSGRCVYGGVAEISVYVAGTARRQGVGRALIMAVIDASEQAGLWTLQGHILRENTASLALVAVCGFRQVGFRERLGSLRGEWRDIVLVERRSDRVGV
jgi:L-amino acid N-acyltransferase YncA